MEEDKVVTTIDVSELFYSLQGEGVSLGHPAVFLRVSKCNLCCGCGNLRIAGEASWTCDSQAVMSQYETKTAEEVLEKIKELGDDIYLGILLGEIHFIITGGEPLVYKEGLSQLLNLLDRESVKYQKELKIDPRAMKPPVYELETNGTIFSGPSQFYEKFSYINCSPKLKNSGMSKDKRILPFALLEISKHPNHFFKFVISSKDDWKEIEEDFINPKFVDKRRIFLMPAGATREEMIESSAVVWQLVMEQRVLATTRLHVIAWNDKKSI